MAETDLLLKRSIEPSDITAIPIKALLICGLAAGEPRRQSDH
jgi:hypothetical protein